MRDKAAFYFFCGGFAASVSAQLGYSSPHGLFVGAAVGAILIWLRDHR